MQLSPEQKNLIKQTLMSIVQGAVMRSMWGLPLWKVVALGVAAFGLLFWLGGSQ